MVRAFTEADLGATRPDARVGPPDFVGVGLGKSGGSWWYDLLLEHPQVERNRLDSKELHFFCHQDYRAPDAAAIDLYRQAFARSAGKVCGEWSGNFLNHPLSILSLAEAAPDAKLIAILRNPVDRCVSNLNQFLSVRAKNLALEGDRFELLRDYSLYTEAMWSCLVSDAIRTMQEHYPADRILVMQYEAVRQDPASHFRRTCEFLGIDPSFRPRDFSRPVNRKDYVVPKPDPATRARIAQYFRADVERTKDLLPSLDLSLWTDFAELSATRGPSPAAAPTQRPLSTRAEVEAVLGRATRRRLLLGCGQRPEPNFVNVDLDPGARSDLRLDAADLATVPDRCVDEIRSYHLFEHFTRAEARRALAEWHRVLRPGGELHLELPNLAVCAQELGRHFDPHGEDLALTGLFGPPERAADPSQRHNWGWTPEGLCEELERVGFHTVSLEPVDQSWRLGTPFHRDMHLRALR